MILASYVYDTILDLIRKDQHGNSFNITEYNNFIKLVNYELYNIHAPVAGENLQNIDVLKDFMTLEESITITTGVGDLPATYDRLLGKPYWIDGGYDISIDLITSLEKSDRLSSNLTAPSFANPVAIIGGVDVSGNSQISVYPAAGITTIYIDFLSIPATPILDYYVASTGLYVYMDAGATNVAIPTGAVYSDGTIGPTTKNSATVNFEWHEDQTPTIINMILQKAGIVLKQQTAIEYGLAKENIEA